MLAAIKTDQMVMVEMKHGVQQLGRVPAAVKDCGALWTPVVQSLAPHAIHFRSASHELSRKRVEAQ
jgi:hypothetical protein